MATVLVQPASADQVADLKARATAISQGLVQDQLTAETYQQQVTVATNKLASDASGIAANGVRISDAEVQIKRDSLVVQRQAVRSYIDAGSDLNSPEVALFTGQEESVQAANEYTTIAVGSIDTELGQLQRDRRSLQASEGALQEQEARDQADRRQRALDFGQAVGAESQLKALQGQVTGQLAVAIQQEAAAQAAAMAARAVSTPHTDPELNSFLQCALRAESSGNYGAVSPNGMYMGAFQFLQSTWNEAAMAAGRPDLVGVPPNHATKTDQDAMAVTLFAMDGEQPWYDPCRS